MRSGKSIIHRYSIFANIALSAFFIWYFFVHIGADVYYRKYVSPRETYLDNVYYESKVDSYAGLNEKLSRDQAYTIFIGDSLIEQFPVKELFPDAQVINRGIGLDTTIGVLKRLEKNMNNVNIGKSFLMIGYNDLKYRSVEETAGNIETIMARIKAKKRYFISILPCRDSVYNEKIKQVNLKIKMLSQKSGFEYLDCYSLFVDSNGKQQAQYYYDGVHLTLPGYLKIKELLQSSIKS